MRRRTVSGIMLTLLFIGTLALAFNIRPVKAEPTTWTVDDDGPADFTSIQEAINAANSGDTIYVHNGTYYESIVLSKPVSLVGENPVNTIIDGFPEVRANNVRIENFCIVNGSITLENVNNCIIKDNHMTNTWEDFSIALEGSSYNSISGNHIDGGGIALFHDSSYNNVSENNIKYTRLPYLWEGIHVSTSSSNSISGNNITTPTKFDFYVKEGVGIAFYSCSNNSISRNNVVNNDVGIFFDYSPGNSIHENNITNNYPGVLLLRSGLNNISGNYIENNTWGLYLDESPYTHELKFHNKIYHNNFINNSQQVYDPSWDHTYKEPSINIWDNDYPSGGNYWSDYEERYPNAEELDESGIWDTPYVIDENNQDNYPLMKHWTPIPRTIDELKTKIQEFGSRCEIDNHGIVKSLTAKLNVAQKLVDKGKIDEAKTILADDFILQVRNLSGIHIMPEAADILIKSAEYIISHL